MTIGSTNDILAMAVPIVLAIIMGILGTLRGFWREAIVAGSIVLGALIVQQWAALWADDLYGMYTGASREMQQVVLSQLLLSLIVLVLGYGLGTLVRGGRLSGASRMGGLLLGLANGSAIGGWLLRYIYISLDASQPSSPLYQNAVTQAFMIWAGWFPVALAAIGAIVALISPFRRSEVEVTQTAPAPVWTPPPPAPGYTTQSASTTTAYGAPPPGRIPGTVGAATPYDRTVANLSPYAVPEPRPQAPYDAPRTQAFPGLDVPPPAPTRDPYDPYNPNPYGNPTQSFYPPAGDVGAAPPTGVLPGSNQAAPHRQPPIYRSGLHSNADTDSDIESLVDTPSPGDTEASQTASSVGPEALRPSSDWLAESSVAPAKDQPERTAGPSWVDSEEPQHQEVDEEPEQRQDQDRDGPREPELRAAEADAPGTADETSEAPATEVAATTYAPTEVTCANCGAAVLNNAKFCTECGTPVAGG